jgi:hypothetical protein
MPSDTKDNRNTSRPQAAAGAQQGQTAGAQQGQTAGAQQGQTAGAQQGQPPDLAPVFLAQNFVPPPSFQDVLSTPTADLYANKAQAAADYENITHIILSDEERTALSGKRYPEINDVALLFAKGLDLHPEIVAATEVTPAALRTVVDQDGAAKTLIAVGGKLSLGGGDGAILTSATVETLTSRVLGQVTATIADKNTDPNFRSDLEAGFAAAFRLQTQRQQAAQKVKTQNQKAVTSAEQKREQAENAAAQSKALDAFSTAIKATRT